MQIQRESVGIVQLEGILTGERLLTGIRQLLLHICQNAKPLIDGLVEVLFLLIDHTVDKLRSSHPAPDNRRWDTSITFLLRSARNLSSIPSIRPWRAARRNRRRRT